MNTSSGNHFSATKSPNRAWNLDNLKSLSRVDKVPRGIKDWLVLFAFWPVLHASLLCSVSWGTNPCRLWFPHSISWLPCGSYQGVSLMRHMGGGGKEGKAKVFLLLFLHLCLTASLGVAVPPWRLHLLPGSDNITCSLGPSSLAVGQLPTIAYLCGSSASSVGLPTPLVPS